MKKIFTLSFKSTIVFFVAVITSCQDGEDGLNSIISTSIDETECDAGGIQINYGLDLNRNNVLEESEIENSEYICNGVDGTVELDNLTRIELGSPNEGICGTDWYRTPYKTFEFPDFNKLDYPNVNSVLFVPSMVSFDEDNTVTVELYNVTDDVPIENSTLLHNSTEYVFKYSDNIYDFLPEHPITLSIRMKNSGTDKCGGLGVRSYLYILRE